VKANLEALPNLAVPRKSVRITYRLFLVPLLDAVGDAHHRPRRALSEFPVLLAHATVGGRFVALLPCGIVGIARYPGRERGSVKI
jgi:hypothetical protein